MADALLVCIKASSAANGHLIHEARVKLSGIISSNMPVVCMFVRCSVSTVSAPLFVLPASLENVLAASPCKNIQAMGLEGALPTS